VPIRLLRPDEIPSVVPLLEEAYARRAPFEERLRRYLAIEPEGWLVCDQDGARTGMVGVVIHGVAAYVGLMAVQPSQQGRGLGRALLDAALAIARARRAGLVMLDASDMGVPLYRKAGFADRGRVLDCVYEGGPRTGPCEAVGIDDVIAFDREHFGADRSRTLRAFAEGHPGRLVAVRRAGKVAAYALAQRNVIGPVVADDGAAARAVIDAALAMPFDGVPRLLAPEEHGPLLEAEGFRSTRTLLHMRLGGPDVAYRVVGKASLAVG
jgi:GNAT superfamily N-acetyltransferase